MELPKNRMAQPAQRTPRQDAVVDTTIRRVPPLVGPCCGRGMQPKVERWRNEAGKGEVADCLCALCGKRFVYSPATVRQ